MKIYLTKTRWNALALTDDGGVHPRPLSVELLTGELGLATRDAIVTLSGLIKHGVLTRVGAEYRCTRKGAELVQRMRVGTIDDVTLEVDDD